jgi:uncharacterized MnhB-related membrane protein
VMQHMDIAIAGAGLGACVPRATYLSCLAVMYHSARDW